MEYYHKFNFVSPEPIFAEIREELKSYFDTGIVDDLLFPKYTEKCLKRLGRVSFKVSEGVFQVRDNHILLPDDFQAAREVWLCSTNSTISHQLPNAHYEQNTYRITPLRDRCNPCDFCGPQEVKITLKTTNAISHSFKIRSLLKPGNIMVKPGCENLQCFNNIFYNNSYNRNYLRDENLYNYDIIDNKLITNFNDGYIYMVYYKLELDDYENQLIPDNIRVEDYIKAYLKYKCFETIYNQVTDETFRQVESKFLFYKSQAEEAWVLADIELKRQNIYQVVDSIKRQKRRFNKYQIR